MVEVTKIMAISFKGPMHTVVHSASPILQQATADPHLCQRLLDTHGQVWVGLLWGHCSFLLGPGAHKVLFVPSKSPFPQSCVSSGGSMMGLMANSSKRAYAILAAAPRAPAPAGDLLEEAAIILVTSTIVLASKLWPQVKQQGGDTALPINRKLD